MSECMKLWLSSPCFCSTVYHLEFIGHKNPSRTSSKSSMSSLLSEVFSVSFLYSFFDLPLGNAVSPLGPKVWVRAHCGTHFRASP